MRANHLKAAEQRFLIEVRCEGHTEDNIKGQEKTPSLSRKLSVSFTDLRGKQEKDVPNTDYF